VPQRKGEPLLFSRDEHPRSTTAEALAKLRGVVRADGTVTAGNASGVNDGACALLLASERRWRPTIFNRWPGWSAWRRRGGAAYYGLWPGAGGT
jgi:acetyl-CoA acetyltransferase